MRKIFCVALALFCSASVALAQEQPQQPDHVLPMFGGKQKTEAEQRRDEKFLSSCDVNFSSRPDASTFFMERGWEYLNEGQVDTAMHRFNLAWLLNPDNKETYWAFGLVTAARGDQEQAIDLYDKALALDPKNSLLQADLAAAYLSLYRDQQKKKYLKKASGYLGSSLAAEPNNAFSLFNFAMVKFYEKKYGEAWDYLHKGRMLDMSQLDYEFVMELVAKMPDPQGFFKEMAPAPAAEAAAN